MTLVLSFLAIAALAVGFFAFLIWSAKLLASIYDDGSAQDDE